MSTIHRHYNFWRVFATKSPHVRENVGPTHSHRKTHVLIQQGHQLGYSPVRHVLWLPGETGIHGSDVGIYDRMPIRSRRETTGKHTADTVL
jgi:hypothetical protein